MSRPSGSFTALVTGGSGFVGPYVIRELLARGHDVVALARSERSASFIEELGAQPIPGDLDDPESIDTAFAASNGDTLVNIASLGFGHAPTIVHAAEDAGVRRAVFVSTTAIFTNLSAPSKAVRTSAEAAITGSQLEWTIIRPTMIYGSSGDRNMWRLLRAVRKAPVLPLPGAHNLHQPIHVEDLACAIVNAAERPWTARQAYDVAGAKAITLEQVVRDASAAVDSPTRTISIPAGPVMGLLAAVERLGKRLPISAEQVARLAEDKAFDISAAETDLDFAPRSFADGIRQEAAETS